MPPENAQDVNRKRSRGSRVRTLRLPAELDARVEEARGDVDFGVFVRGALEEKLAIDGGVAARESVHPASPEGSVPPDSACHRPPASASPRASAPMFGCPTSGCEFTARSPRACCPRHGRRLRELVAGV